MPAAKRPPAPAAHHAKPAATPAPAAHHAKPAATPPPAPAKAVALDRASLDALVARIADADHFTVLGVPQDAPVSQIKLAFFQLAKAYHPDAVPTDAAPEVKKLCADVFAKISEAWSVLGNDAARVEYLDALKSGGTAEVDVLAIFKAENTFQAATMLVKARKYEDALRGFDEAIALNPDEPEFSMWKAWCEFILAADKRKQHGLASAAIQAALTRNPRCAQGYLFLGQMAKIVGDVALAEKQLRRGLQVVPDSTDLQRELRYLRK